MCVRLHLESVKKATKHKKVVVPGPAWPRKAKEIRHDRTLRILKLKGGSVATTTLESR